ncbi:MAG: MFS transporter [Deltaproteobacteria bacterium]|nr:MFS transporter [Deltaproteobacteria bacterium]
MEGELRSRPFVSLILASTFNAWAFYSLVPTLPLYLFETLGLSFSEIGLVISSFSISVILFRPFAGYIVDRIPRTKLLKITLAAVSLIYAIYPSLDKKEELIILRILHGILFGISSSALSAIAADSASLSKIGQAISLYSLTIPLGMIIGSVTGLTLLKHLGAQVMFQVTLFVSLLSLFFTIFLGSFYPLKEKKHKSVISDLLLKDAIPFSLSMIFPMVIYGAVNTFVSIHAKQTGLRSVEVFFLLFSIFLLLARFFTGKLFDRGKIRTLLFTGIVLIFFGTLGLGFSMTDCHFFLSGILCGSGFGILMPTCQAAINVIAEPQKRGSANSTYFLSYDLGIGVSSYMLGHLLDTTPVGSVYLALSLLCLVSAFLMFKFAIPQFEIRAAPRYRQL